MKKALQWFLGLFGVIAIIIAALHIVLGPSSIPGSVPVNATMDSEDRFYAVLLAAYGAALLWCIQDVEKKSRYVHFLSATFFVGGVARLISFAAVGPPNEFFRAMTALELLIPVYMSLAQRRIARGPRSGEAVQPGKDLR
jgi:putative copper export protein